MHFKLYTDDRETFRFWKTAADAMYGVHVVDVVLIVGLLYIVATYYRSYGNSDDRWPVVVDDDEDDEDEDDDPSGARGDVPRSKRLDAGRDKNDRDRRLRRTTVDVRSDRYETLTAEIVGMWKRQQAMDKTLAGLRVGQTGGDGTAGHDTDGDFSGNVADLDRKFDALKIDFDRLQRTNEKLVRKCDGLKLRLGTLEREVTTNSSVIIGSSCRAGHSAAFDGPAVPWTADHRDLPATYSDGYQRHPIDYDVIQTATSVRTNNVVGPVPSCPPLPPSSCPPPPPPPPPPKALKDDPALRVYTPIPITTEILKTVTLVKAGSGIPKIKVPSGWITKKKKSPAEE